MSLRLCGAASNSLILNEYNVVINCPSEEHVRKNCDGKAIDADCFGNDDIQKDTIKNTEIMKRSNTTAGLIAYDGGQHFSEIIRDADALPHIGATLGELDGQLDLPKDGDYKVVMGVLQAKGNDILTRNKALCEALLTGISSRVTELRTKAEQVLHEKTKHKLLPASENVSEVTPTVATKPMALVKLIVWSVIALLSVAGEAYFMTLSLQTITHTLGFAMLLGLGLSLALLVSVHALEERLATIASPTWKTVARLMVALCLVYVFWRLAAIRAEFLAQTHHANPQSAYWLLPLNIVLAFGIYTAVRQGIIPAVMGLVSPKRKTKSVITDSDRDEQLAFLEAEISTLNEEWSAIQAKASSNEFHIMGRYLLAVENYKRANYETRRYIADAFKEAKPLGLLFFYINEPV